MIEPLYGLHFEKEDAAHTRCFSTANIMTLRDGTGNLTQKPITVEGNLASQLVQ